MYKEYFNPFPVLKTKRLVLRQLKKSDANDLFLYCHSPSSSMYGTWKNHETVSDTRKYISWLLKSRHRGEYFTFAIEVKDSKKVIGTCSLNDVDAFFKVAEMGYGITKEYWGKGYASEAVRAVMEYCFCTVGFQKLTARIMRENTRSLNLARAVGMNKEGFVKKGVYAFDGAKDVYIFGITDCEYSQILNDD